MDIIKKIEKCFNSGGKLIIFGNGGSAAEASHLAAEFIGIGLPAVALSDPAILTALSNDYGYEEVFDLWVEALYKPEDLIIGLSSSGKSENIIKGLSISVNSIDFPRKGRTRPEIQENQLKLIHKIYAHFK